LPTRLRPVRAWTTTIVRCCSSHNSRSNRQIACPLIESRLPVGFVAKNQSRIVDQGAGDCHTLLLAAAERVGR